VLGFLARLEAGEIESALRLYLSGPAYTRSAAELTSLLVGAGLSRPYEDASLTDWKETAAGYEARALLVWGSAGEAGPASQTMVLVLVYERGLWRIDSIRLEGPITPTPTPTPTGAPRGSRPAKPTGRLVFQVSSGGDIYVVKADGIGLRRLTDGLDPAWSPAGDKIAFTRWRTPWGLYLINPDGSGEERLIDGIRLKEATWSPDGAQLLVTLNVSSGEPIEFCIPGGPCFTLPPFSYGQMWLLERQGAADPSGSASPFLSLPLDSRAAHSPTWNPMGKRIVYAGAKGLAWIDVDTLETGPIGGGSVWDSSPAFSPDGSTVAYMGRGHSSWEIWAMNADGSGRRRLTQGEAAASSVHSVAPAWSPDGKQIAFLTNRDGPWRIYVMNADGSNQRSLFGDKLDRLGIRYEWASERVIAWSR
jgi:dipeptidyl aminopeptidase/acylaminoacyl peptidase